MNAPLVRLAPAGLMVAAVLVASGLGPGPGPGARPDGPAAYLDTTLTAEVRARDLVGRMTADEKIAQLHERRAGHSAARGSVIRVVERMPPRRRASRRSDGVSAGHRHGGVVRRAAASRGGDRRQRRGTREASRVRAARPARALPGPDVLVAQHQHLQGSPLGSRTGNLRRRSVPDVADGRRLRHRPAGRRSALPEGRRHGQAFRRAQRPGSRSPPLRRPPERARSVRDVSARHFTPWSTRARWRR